MFDPAQLTLHLSVVSDSRPNKNQTGRSLPSVVSKTRLTVLQGTVLDAHGPDASGLPPVVSKGYVSASAIAARYAVTVRYIYKLAAEGVIPCIRLGPKCIRFSETDVARALES